MLLYNEQMLSLKYYLADVLLPILTTSRSHDLRRDLDRGVAVFSATTDSGTTASFGLALGDEGLWNIH